MIPSFRERGPQAKQEGETGEKTTPSTSRQWSAFRNPRIVRVSSSFGGKDRHSKVCTIRGLRDRRIRLSVPTAIQLYDLQDRLGLSQPSKVLDWLLDATKDDIDKLPPLQIPPGFGQFHQPMLASLDSRASQSPFAPFLDANSTFMRDHTDFRSLGIKISSGLDEEEMERSKRWEVDASLRGQCKEVETDTERGKWIKTIEQENEGGISNYEGQFSAQKLFPVASHSSLPGFANNPLPFNSHYQWDAPNLSLSHLGGHGFPSQAENLPSSQLSLSSGGSQLFFCPPAPMPSLFPPYPPYISPPVVVDQSREINHFQLLGSSSQQHILTGSRPTMASPASKPFSLNERQSEKDGSDS